MRVSSSWFGRSESTESRWVFLRVLIIIPYPKRASRYPVPKGIRDQLGHEYSAEDSHSVSISARFCQMRRRHWQRQESQPLFEPTSGMTWKPFLRAVSTARSGVPCRSPNETAPWHWTFDSCRLSSACYYISTKTRTPLLDSGVLEQRAFRLNSAFGNNSSIN